MNSDPLLEWLELSEGVWLRGPPGSGRTHRLQRLAQEWPGPVVWLRGVTLEADLALLGARSAAVLVCVDGIPSGTARSVLAGSPTLVTGAHPGEGWRVATREPMDDDEGVRLFLQHAPGSGPLPLIRRLVRRLGGHPMAIIAATRRWPMERVDQILLETSPSWPGLQGAYAGLDTAEQETLAFLAALSGPARLEGIRWCGMVRGVEGLISAGWVSVQTPGIYTLPPAIADAVRGWKAGNPAPYYAWYLQETRTRALAWDTRGGSREWFRCGMWPAMLKEQPAAVPEWFVVAWSLSGEDPALLRAALLRAALLLDGDTVAVEGLSPLVRARCEARSYQAAGEREQAIVCLQGAKESGGEPEQGALLCLELGVAYHRLRRLEAAEVAYGEALERLEALSHARGSMLCRANMAALAHDTHDYAAAHAGYTAAIEEASRLGALRLRGMFSGNLGALLIETESLSEARALLHQASRDLAVEPDDRFLAIVLVNRAAVDLQEDHLDAATEHYHDAIRLLGTSDPASTALCHARLGAVAALRGELTVAREHHERADALVSPLEDPFTTRLVSLWRVFLEWQTGDRASALARRRENLAGKSSLRATSDEARLVFRILERRIAEPGSTLLVGPGGSWFRVPGEPKVGVDRYAAVMRILAVLAQTAELTPGEPCSADVLIEAGWPGERIIVEAARNRLSVALARLRRLGLRGVLQRTGGGWRLDPAWPVLLLQED
ncbi:MAG: tetratricopeptide (TPR) repeat protein [Myxococcota bacterium]